MARVCMIAYSDYVADARIRREAESLAERGDQVECVCLPHGDGAASTVLNAVRVLPVRMKRYRGSSAVRYVMSYLSFFWRSLLFVAWRHLRRRYDLVQVHTMPDFMVFAALVPRLMGAKVILDVHDLMPELYMSKFNLDRDHVLIRAITWMERGSIAFAHKAIAVHQPHLDVLVSHGSRRERFEVLLNTPDPAVFGRTAVAEGEKARGFKLVYHGTISRRHGLELALRAAALARREVPDLRLSIIGDGDDAEAVARLAADLGLDGSFEFTRKFVPVNALPALLAGAHLGIVPLKKDSFTQYMLPVKLMEYVSLGIPAIVTRTRTIERYFDDTMVEYISGESVEELARSIAALHADRERRVRLAENAREFARRHNWDSQKLVYYRLVDSLVNGKSRSAARVPYVEQVERAG